MVGAAAHQYICVSFCNFDSAFIVPPEQVMFRVMPIPRKLLTLILIGVSMFGSVKGSPDKSPTEKCNVSLNLTDVGLRSLPDGFIGDDFVTHLSLDGNEISSVLPEAFSFVPRLSYLSLARNQLTILALHPFSELQDLNTLILNENCKAPIRPPSPNSYRYNYNHRYYDSTTMSPSHVQFEYCSLQLNSYLRSLTHLYVEKNDLKSVSFTEELPALTHLHLSHNPLETMPGFNSCAPALTHLYLQYCEILEFDSLHVPGMTSLHLDGNKIQSICNKYCEDLSLKLNGARELEVLYASYNRISKIEPDSFNYTINLTILDLSHNQILEIREGTFDKLHSLRSLSLEHNNLVKLSDNYMFGSLINLQNLSLGYNNISHMTGQVFENLAALKKLTLDHNEISNIEVGTFLNLTSLEELSLATNLLSKIPEQCVPISGSLITLNLDTNRFESVENISIANATRLLSLSLKDNPLTGITSRWFADVSPNLQIILGSSC